MVNSDEKVSKFVEAVTAYAEEQSQRIHQEVEDFKAQRLYEAEQQALQAAYEMIQRENAGYRVSGNHVFPSFHGERGICHSLVSAGSLSEAGNHQCDILNSAVVR